MGIAPPPGRPGVSGTAGACGFCAWRRMSVFNYTDILRQAQNPQAPAVPETPGLPGGGAIPNPLHAPPSGSGVLSPEAPGRDARGMGAHPFGSRGN